MTDTQIGRKLRTVTKHVGERLPAVAIVLLFYLPLSATVLFSFWDRSGLWMEPAFNLNAYFELTPIADQLANSIIIGLITGGISVMISFPVAYYATFKTSDQRQMVLLSVLAIPFFVSPFIRTTMLIPLLGDSGLLNSVLIGLGLIDAPISLIFSDKGVIIGALLTHTPVVIFSGWLSMSMIDEEMIDAGQDLGARPLTTIRTVVVPLALPGLSVGALFVVASTIGSVIYPVVLGGPSSTSVGLLVQRSFTQLNIPRASAIMVISSIIFLVGLAIIAQKIDIERMFTQFE